MTYFGVKRSTVKVTVDRNRSNLWKRYFKNKWTDFAANWHKCSTDKGMKRLALWFSRSKSRLQEVEIGQTCENDISKTNEPILLQTGTSGPPTRAWSDQLCGSRGQNQGYRRSK